MLLCEFILNSAEPAATQGPLYLTLLQLYLAQDEPEQVDGDSAPTVSPEARR